MSEVTPPDGIDYDDVGFVASSHYRTEVLDELTNGPATPTAISDACGHRLTHSSRALCELRDRGLVELLVPDDTKKGRIYGVTDDGRAVLQGLDAITRGASA